MGSKLTKEQKSSFCGEMSDLLIFGSPYWNTFLDYGMVIAGFVTLAISVQILTHKHLRSHPAPVIDILCLFESFFLFMGFSRNFVCHGGDYEGIVAATILWDTSEAA